MLRCYKFDTDPNRTPKIVPEPIQDQSKVLDIMFSNIEYMREAEKPACPIAWRYRHESSLKEIEQQRNVMNWIDKQKGRYFSAAAFKRRARWVAQDVRYNLGW